MKGYPVFVIASALVLAAFLWLAADRTARLREVADDLASFEALDRRAVVTLDTWLEQLTGDWFARGGVTRDDLEVLDTLAARWRRELVWIGLGSVAALAAFVALPAWWRRGRRDTVQHLVLASVALLGLGFWAPLLTLTVRYDAPVVGRVVLDTTTKGLLESVQLFLSGPDWLLGVVILLFSVLVPIVKLVWIQVLILGERLGASAVTWLSHVGKFSMLDVFVAALTVALFAFSGSGTTDARAGVGLYFFAGYCVTSLLASVVLERQHRFEAARVGAASVA
jgi:paraquat-inducible protein A